MHRARKMMNILYTNVHVAGGGSHDVYIPMAFHERQSRDYFCQPVDLSLYWVFGFGSVR
ncbi:Uncharacterised protein [Budvicia aquatica]|uniref:Uncharacterized protein n=1 Tax=Budvicia aquatica TaxID=82979 RepID=A0A484ZUC6_9GAMM|nr:Uncharacterised protein [Budvicia aquatica]